MKPVYFILIFLLLFSCKKYSEGGTYASVKRIFKNESDWSVTRFEVNGIDSTDYIVSNGDMEYAKNYVHLFKHSRMYYHKTRYQPSMSITLTDEYMSLSPQGGQRAFDTTSSGIKIRRVLTPAGGTMKWFILKHKNKELVLRASYENYSYRLTLKDN
jgi:hypothetical protein